MDGRSLSEVWTNVLGTQPDPPRWLVLTAAVVALVAVVPHPLWRISRNVVTIAHEGGHAAAAVLSGRRLTGIRLHSDTSGVTVSRGKPYGPGMVATGAAGYITPSLLGLLGAVLLTAGHITALLWLAVVGLAALLVMIRNVYGVASVLVTGGLVFVVSWFGTPTAQAGFAYAFTWFLLVGGARPVVELQRLRRRGQAPQSDADQLARLTGLHPLLWVALFAFVALTCLLLGARWLLG
ncbi:M50 family metallopeptidase [Cryptosporangium aurantiacum]|uniref:Peptidase M50B-like n=1 Tax=Cryptosporangium aurantiacum TaxID=134849 RepID=A0A1M7QY21_9ACTN|nr:M50 family metallopeptidase [Cryptosporangium aurantiacum]SHN36651.1 Peptidase M50B-like [Cryptosporangium aurantiacum]